MNLIRDQKNKYMFNGKSSDQSKFFRRICLMCPISPISPMEIMRQIGRLIKRRNVYKIFKTGILSIIIFVFFLAYSVVWAQKKKDDQDESHKKSYKFQKPEGEYLVEGGSEFLKIEKKSVISKVNDLYEDAMLYYYTYGSSKAKYSNNKLKYTVYNYHTGKKELYSYASIDNNTLVFFERNSQGTRYYSNKEFFVPSDNIEGDWDLVRNSDDKNGFRIPSFLHRIDKDSGKINTYFKNASLCDDSETTGKPPEIPGTLLKIASALSKKFPDDYFIRTIYYDALIRNEKFKQLEEDLNKHEGFYNSTSNILLTIVYNKSRRAVYADKLSKSGKNSYDYMNKILNKNLTLQEKIGLLGGLNKYTDFIIPAASISHHSDFYREPEIFWYMATMDFFRQILTGERGKALNTISGIYSMGNLLMLDVYDRGRHLRSGGGYGFELMLNNCCETKDDITSITAAIDIIYKNCIKPNSHVREIDKYFKIWYTNVDLEINRKNEILLNYTKLITLKCAVRLKNSYIETKKFPKSVEQIEKILEYKIPQDPFSLAPIKILKTDNGFIFYSIGPDLIDDLGVLNYDSSNGIISSGDIITKLTERIEFPYQRNGLSANRKEDVELFFKKGLLPDNINNLVIQSISGDHDNIDDLLSISDTTPVIIYSQGIKSQRTSAGYSKKQHESYIPTIQYDPTNGVYSGGDIFWELPRRENHEDKIEHGNNTARNKKRRIGTTEGTETHEKERTVTANSADGRE